MATLTNRYSGLITGGLGLPACSGLIVNTFGVTTCLTIIPIRESGGSSGGSIPLLPGEIQNFYTPVDTQVTKTNTGNLAKPGIYGKKIVKITVSYKKMKTEKEFMINKEQEKMLVNILNLMNTTKSRIKITIDNLKKITNKLKIEIKNLHVKTKF